MSSTGSIGMIQDWNRAKVASTRSNCARIGSLVLAAQLLTMLPSRIRKQRALLFILIAVLSSVSVRAFGQAAHTSIPEVWLSGVDPVVLHDRDKNAADNDFMEEMRTSARHRWESCRTSHLQTWSRNPCNELEKFDE